MHERDAEVKPPLHAAREGPRPLIRALGQADHVEDPGNAALQLLRRQSVERAEETQVLGRTELGIKGELLWNEADGTLEAAVARLEPVAADENFAVRGSAQAG